MPQSALSLFNSPGCLLLQSWSMAWSVEVLAAGLTFSLIFPCALALLLTWCGYLEYQAKLRPREDGYQLDESKPGENGEASETNSERLQQLRASRNPALASFDSVGSVHLQSSACRYDRAFDSERPQKNPMLESLDSAASVSSCGSLHVNPMEIKAAKDKVKFTGLAQNLQVDPAV